MKGHTLAIQNNLSHSRGFTLIEMLGVLGLLSIVILATVSIYIKAAGQYFEYRNRSGMLTDSALLSDYLTKIVQNSGGGAVRAWMSVHVENDCAARGDLPDCGGSDRLTVVRTFLDSRACPIVSQVDPTSITSEITGGTCCLRHQAAMPPAQHRPVLLVHGDHYFRQAYGSVISGGGQCHLQFTNGQAGFGDFSKPDGDWAGGLVSVLEIETLFLDKTTNELRSWTDVNGDGLIDPNFDNGELKILATSVFDFQVALGFDFNPPDLDISDGNGNTAADEWLYNAPGEGRAIGLFADADNNELRAVRLGLILGSQSPKAAEQTPAPESVLDGAPIQENGWYMYPTVHRINLRNLGIFQ